MSVIKICYLIESRDEIHVKIDKNKGQMLSGKYSAEKLLDSAKIITCAFKTASKRPIQKTAEATDGLLGNKIADKITRTTLQKSSSYLMALIQTEDKKKYTYHLTKGNQLLINID